MGVLKGLTLDYWLIWLCQIIAKELQIVVCVSVFVCMCVSVDSCRPGFFCLIGQWQNQLLQSGCIINAVSAGIIVLCVELCLFCD